MLVESRKKRGPEFSLRLIWMSGAKLTCFKGLLVGVVLIFFFSSSRANLHKYLLSWGRSYTYFWGREEEVTLILGVVGKKLHLYLRSWGRSYTNFGVVGKKLP